MDQKFYDFYKHTFEKSGSTEYSINLCCEIARLRVRSFVHNRIEYELQKHHYPPFKSGGVSTCRDPFEDWKMPQCLAGEWIRPTHRIARLNGIDVSIPMDISMDRTVEYLMAYSKTTHYHVKQLIRARNELVTAIKNALKSIKIGK